MIILNNTIKLIDFGQVKLIDKINERGNLIPFTVNILFNNDIRFKRISILTDIFSVIISLFYSIYLIKNVKTHNSNFTYENLKHTVIDVKSNDKITKILLLGDLIYLFYNLTSSYISNIDSNIKYDFNIN
jgi:hypothetical protein